MKTLNCISAFCLIVAASTLRAADLPIAFARSGQQITLPVRDNQGRQEKGSIALWAFERRWEQPLTARNGEVELTAPKVRVPVVFRLLTENGRRVVDELVVYPGPSAHWDDKTQLASLGTPDWFNTWAEAVGLPVQKLKEPRLGNAGYWRTLDKPALLILGEKASENDMDAVFRLAAECQSNVLVLGTDWFRWNETASRETVVSPQQMAGPLADLHGQDWALPPAFSERRLRIANRETWIAGPEHPAVEELRGPLKGTESLRTVVSCLAWQQQLGRNETADKLLLRLLEETANGAKDRRPLADRWRLVYPATNDIKPGERPVLAAALHAMEDSPGDEADRAATRGYVLDLRGKLSPPADFFDSKTLRKIESGITVRSQLLILGDDPALDRWEWLKLDRAAGKSLRPGVLWWRDSSLPSSVESQLRLMRLFTEWNIPLRKTVLEAKYDDR